jgi:hypothetical protein
MNSSLRNFIQIFQLLTFGAMFITASVVGQPLSWSQNNKYWSFRNRLVNKFVVRGVENNACDDPSGLSIAANWRLLMKAKLVGTGELKFDVQKLATENRLRGLRGSLSEKL